MTPKVTGYADVNELDVNVWSGVWRRVRHGVQYSTVCTGVSRAPGFGLGTDFCWTRTKFLETISSLRRSDPQISLEISGKSVTTGDRQRALRRLR